MLPLSRQNYPFITFYTPRQNNLDQRAFAQMGASAQNFWLSKFGVSGHV
jgi:hypothetical protein